MRHLHGPTKTRRASVARVFITFITGTLGGLATMVLGFYVVYLVMG